MRILSHKEWAELYQTQWRPLIAHLSKQQRLWYVRQCFGKTAFVDRAEAYPQMTNLPEREGVLLGVYCCALCRWWHIGNSRRRMAYRLIAERAKEKAQAEAHALPSSSEKQA